MIEDSILNSKYDEKYIFRIANTDDIDCIMLFIRTHWHKNHILATNRAFFCYQHLIGDRINFILAINKETTQIEAIEGFIQYSKELIDIAPVMWRVADYSQMPFLGIELVKREKILTGCRFYGSPGASPDTTVQLTSKLLKHAVGKMDHFYQLSADVQDYKIAMIYDKTLYNKTLKVSSNSSMCLILFDDYNFIRKKFDFSDYITSLPYKDGWFIKRRYFDHPVYKYIVWGVCTQNCTIKGVLFAREIKQNTAKILRIVDYRGDIGALAGLRKSFEKLLVENKYEYIDFYCAGIPRSILFEAGFIIKDERNGDIIPNYFEPFIQKNIDIWYNMSDSTALVFKGDGDQDRPNFV